MLVRGLQTDRLGIDSVLRAPISFSLPTDNAFHKMHTSSDNNSIFESRGDRDDMTFG